jgi:hypothetical protein
MAGYYKNIAYGIKSYSEPVKRKEKMISGYTREEHQEAWNGDYFDSGEDCTEHNTYHCRDCTKQALREMKEINLPAIIAQPHDYNSVDKDDAKKNFENSVDFVKKALNLTDKKMDEIKVKDLGGRMKEAQEKITVGQMKSLLKERIKSKGVLETIFLGFRKFLGL